jgi:uncharacterized protein YecE (DUF72 family)
VAARLRIGVSGWSYDDWWDGNFFPEGLPKSRAFEYLTRRFDTVEFNRSFYSLVRPKTWVGYRDTSPPGFVIAVKGSQFITHSKKLKDVKAPLANFFAQGVLRLEDRLGPVLWQFPRMKWDTARVGPFLDLLPDDTQQASRLARRHDHRLTGRSSMVVHETRPIRHALEFRHAHFLTDEVVRLCRDRGVALVFSDSGDTWAYTEELTAEFVYLRLHGSPEPYASPYDDDQLDFWAERIRAWQSGGEPADAERITNRKPPRRKRRDIYVYFDNDQRANAPKDADKLMQRLGVHAGESESDIAR